MDHGEAWVVHTCLLAAAGFQLLSRAVEPPQRALVRDMSVDVRERAEKWDIALITAMVSLLRWSGRRLAVCFAESFRTIGCVEPSSPTVFGAMQLRVLSIPFHTSSS